MTARAWDPRRTRHLGAAAATIAIGLLVHRRGALLGAALRDVAGDALWAAMIVWGVSALAPAARRRWRGAAAYAVCAAVETAQLVHTPALDAVRATTLGHLVLGSDFDARDLLAYAAGVAAALLLDRVLDGRRRR
ncbi:MAG: DUF2809 domain-containing protein [Gemmatimonadetes bacterium]|nr:DUF2809 domain-containing protein [Gemmatimonadota bacterium]